MLSVCTDPAINITRAYSDQPKAKTLLFPFIPVVSMHWLHCGELDELLKFFAELELNLIVFSSKFLITLSLTDPKFAHRLQ